jgi:hypothetical protein
MEDRHTLFVRLISFNSRKCMYHYREWQSVIVRTVSPKAWLKGVIQSISIDGKCQVENESIPCKSSCFLKVNLCFNQEFLLSF